MSAAKKSHGDRRPSGRRAGDSGTRAAILTAAREQFADKGYDGASLRTIAAAANVDPGLIRHFFGSKDDLFAATVDIPGEVVHPMVRTLVGDPDDIGERVVRAYLGLWENSATARPLLTIVRSAIASDRATEQLHAIVSARLLPEVLPHLQQADGEARAALAGAHLAGVALARYVLRISPIADMDRETLVVHCAPTIQRLLTEPQPD